MTATAAAATSSFDARATAARSALTERVLASFQGAPSARTAEVLRSVVRHLHALAVEVRLTEQEWETAVEFLTRVGQMSDDRRQEAILLSDVLGLSMLVVDLNHPVSEAATASTVFGPFFRTDAPGFSNGDDISGGAKGQVCRYSGRVTSSRGTPIAGARMEVWHADGDGNYDVQYPELDDPQGRGHLRTNDAGEYWFTSILPEPYPIPDDGPVGDLLAAAGRSPMRPAHVHFLISAAGYRPVTTHVFRAGDPHLGSDAVFGERESLIREFTRQQVPGGADAHPLEPATYEMTYDFVLDEVRPADLSTAKADHDGPA